jgi:hypothetical protein
MRKVKKVRRLKVNGTHRLLVSAVDVNVLRENKNNKKKIQNLC